MSIITLEKASIYQETNRILYNVNIVIEANEFVYLIGKTGSGKSSLLKTLYGELPLLEGVGKVIDFDLRKIKPKEIPYLRRKLGIVFQDFQLLTDRDVEENLLFVLQATGWKDKVAMRDRVTFVLQKVGLEQKKKKMPHQLSGGEQQRICIARALLNNPQVLLADEPTGNLDPETSISIMKLFMDIATTTSAVLFATHDYRLFELFPHRTLKCDGGIVLDSDLL